MWYVEEYVDDKEDMWEKTEVICGSTYAKLSVCDEILDYLVDMYGE